MLPISKEIKEKRGWFYIGKIKYFYRNCNNCGNHYEGQGLEFCSYRCSRLANPIVKYGKDNPSWKGDNRKTSLSKSLRISNKWKEWRKLIFERDNYKCLDCGSGGYIEPHHIIPLRIDMNKVFDLDNGVTLCKPCHKKVFLKEEEFIDSYKSLVYRSK